MKIRGQDIVLGASLMVTVIILVYIGHSLPRVLAGFWQLIVLGAAIATSVLMLVWDALFRKQARWYGEKLRTSLQDERDAVEAVRLRNTEMLQAASLKADQAERHEQAALKYRAEAEAKVVDAERRRTNAMGAARRRQRKIEKLETRQLKEGRAPATEVRGARPIS